ncbi:MAG: archease [Acidobacteriia bacterium]|nr:archease [Terriglobia bacterium]
MSGEVPWYRLIDHTGDLAMLVRAATLGELYDAAARALFDVILDVRTVEPRERLEVGVEGAADAEDLLVRFLSELLFLHDSRGWLFRGAEVHDLSTDRLRATAIGEPFDPARHAIVREVKAVTYHHLLLSEDADGWSARLVLDL